MLSRSRLVLSLCGLALAVPAIPASAAADDGQTVGAVQPWSGLDRPSSAGVQPYAQPMPGPSSPAGYQPSGGNLPAPGGYPFAPGFQPSTRVPTGEPEPAAAPPKHHHKGLLGWRHCVECQRARVKARDGVDIPPPPSPAGMVYQSQAPMTMSGPMIMGDPRGGEVIMGSAEPGYTVVGPGMPQDGSGYAVVGGPTPAADPTPIGLARGSMNPWSDPRMAAMSHRPGAPGGGPYDPSVMPSGLPPAPTPMGSAGHDRPHVISHIFHVPRFGQHRQEREDRKREQHAAISYGDPNTKVSELPASMVYGNGRGR